MHNIQSFFFMLLAVVSLAVSAGPVDINSADAATLAAAIEGVGEKKAAAIVRYREAYGPFTRVDELSEVKGIGAATVERNRRNLTVAPAGALDKAVKSR